MNEWSADSVGGLALRLRRVERFLSRHFEYDTRAGTPDANATLGHARVGRDGAADAIEELTQRLLRLERFLSHHFDYEPRVTLPDATDQLRREASEPQPTPTGAANERAALSSFAELAGRAAVIEERIELAEREAHETNVDLATEQNAAATMEPDSADAAAAASAQPPDAPFALETKRGTVDATPALPIASPAVTPPPLPAWALVRDGAIRSRDERNELEKRTHSAAPTSSASALPGFGGFEQLVGLKLAGWIGAIVLVIGAALGVKFAYDQGWLGGVPDSIRVGLLFSLGFAVVAAGEVVYRRAGQLASAGVFGAGVAILFVVGYAGDAYFDLYGQRVAFALMAAASVIGAGVALRAQLASIAVLSLIGANVAPLLIGSSAAGETTLLVYLLALQLLALGLAHVGRGDRWWSLRGLSLVTTSLWVFIRLIDATTVRSVPTVSFTCLYALLFHAEAAIASRQAAMTWAQRHKSFAGFATTVTALLTAAVLIWTRHWPDGQRGATLVAMAMGLIVAGAAGVARAGRASAGRAFRDLAVAWIGQGLALIALAVPVAFDGPAIVVGWLGLSLLYATLGVSTRRPATAVAGAVVWAIAVGYFALFSYDGLSRQLAMTIGDVPISVAILLGVVIAIAGHTTAVLLRSSRLHHAAANEGDDLNGSGTADTVMVGASAPFVRQDARSGRASSLAIDVANVLPILATSVVLVVTFLELPALATTAAWAVFAWATLGAARIGRREGVAWIAVGVAAVTVGKWLVFDVVQTRLGTEPIASPIFNATIGLGFAVSASMVAIVFASAGLRQTRSPKPGGFWGRSEAPPEATDAAVEQGRAIERLLAIGLAVGAVTLALCAEFVPAARQYNVGRGDPWPTAQLASLAQTALVTCIALAMLAVQRWLAPSLTSVRRAFAATVVFLIAKFLALDSLAWVADERFWSPPPFENVQAGVGLLMLTAGAIVAGRFAGEAVGRGAVAASTILPLVVGSIELARAVGADRALVTLSIYWAAYAAAAIAVGFAVRGGAAVRVGGLVLLAITIAKVVFVDLASAGTGWRIVSFLAVGGLLLATSVLYGRFSGTFGGSQLGREANRDAGRGFEVDETS